MRKLVGLGTLLLGVYFNLFAQVDTAYIYNTSMPYGTLDLRLAKSATRYYYLKEGETFSFRESSPGVKTNTFRNMTSWNSEAYQQGHLREKNGSLDYFVLNYRILFPQNYDPAYSAGYPIIMMLHGAGETGNCWGNKCHWEDPTWSPNTNEPPAPTDESHPLLNNDRNLFHGGSQHLAAVNAAAGKLPNDPTLSSKAFPGIVLFPQSLNGWSQPARVEEAIKLLRLIIKKYNIDPNRVYIHGLSNGGWGVNQALKRAPWLFACALTMSAVSDAEIPTQNLDEVSKLPLWIFQGGQDTAPTPTKTFNWVKKLRNAGANVRYYLYPSLGHGTWNTAYKEPDFFTWILDKRKTNPHISYGHPVICNTTGTGVRLTFSKGFLAYQWEKDGQILSNENQSEYLANTPGTYRGRFSRYANPTEDQWENWSDPIEVTEFEPEQPTIIVQGTSHLRGPGLASTDDNNRVILASSLNSELYEWYKNGKLVDFPVTDIDDTLKTAIITTASTSYNGAYTLVNKTYNCPSPASEPVYLFFNNSAPQNITLDKTAFDFKANPSSSSITLSWKDILTNEKGYEVWRRISGSTDFVFAGRTAENAISFLDNGLIPSTTYEYKIRAINNSGRSNYVPADNLSENYIVTTLEDIGMPSPPQELKVTYNSLNSISLSWQPSQDDNGINYYIIHYGNNTVNVPGSAKSYTLENLSANTNYSIYVEAVDYGNHISSASNQIIATTYVEGLWYKHSTGVWKDLDDTTMTATFIHPEFTGSVTNFTLEPRTQEDFFNFQFTGYINITQEGDYTFRTTSDDGSRLLIDHVIIVDNNGKHGNKTIVSDPLHLTVGPHAIEVQYFDYDGNQNLKVQYAGPGISDGQTFVSIPDEALRSGDEPSSQTLDPPTSLTGNSPAYNKITLSWTYANSSAAYEIYRSSDNSDYIIIGRSGTLTFTDTLELAPNTKYFYKLKAITATASSDFSETISVTTQQDEIAPGIPGTPAVLNQGSESVAIAWDAAVDNYKVVKYNVYINGVLAGSTTNTSYTLEGLEGNIYEITIKAVDANNNVSEPSAKLTIDNTTPGLYFSLPEGDLSLLSSWKKTKDGAGDSPVDFTTDGQNFVITNRTTTSLSSPLTVSGSNSKIIVDEDVVLNVNATCDCAIELKKGGRINVNVTETPLFTSLHESSTVQLNNGTNIPKVQYGNLVLAGSETKIFNEDTLKITGNLSVKENTTVTGNGNVPVIKVGGNVVFDSQVATHLFNLIFESNKLHSLVMDRSLSFYQLTLEENATLKLNANEVIDLTTGDNGNGGLSIADLSLMEIGKNNLTITGALNANNEKGLLSFDNDQVYYNSPSALTSHLYSDSTLHHTKKLIVNATQGGVMVVENLTSVSEFIEVNGGVLESKETLQLLATSNGSAQIKSLTNGAIRGKMLIQQHYQNMEQGWREFASPVQDATVKNLQLYFPVNGNFSGATLNSTPTLFSATGTETILGPFPGATQSNEAVLEPAKGYYGYLHNGNDSTALNIQYVGEPNQGSIAVPLFNGDGTSHAGWNLIGNPYAAHLKIDNRISFSGLNPVIAIQEFMTINDQLISKYTYHDLRDQSIVIKPGEAFWMQSFNETPELTLTENNKRYTQENGSGSLQALTITLNQEDITDVAFIRFSENGLDGYQASHDVLKRENKGQFNIATTVDENSVAINDLPVSNCTVNLPIAIKDINPGDYQLNFTNTAIANVKKIKLSDRFTNNEVIISEGTQYNFSVSEDVASYQGRFEIILIKTDSLVNPQVNVAPVCYGSDVTLNLTNARNNYDYYLLNAETEEIISEIAEGDSLSFTISSEGLSAGTNNFIVRSSVRGCTNDFVDQGITVQYPLMTNLVVTNNTSTVCKGSNTTLSIDQEMATYFWLNSNGEVIHSDTVNTFTLQNLQNNTIVYVSALDLNGCKTDTAMYQISVAEAINPTITLSNDTISVDVNANEYQWMKNDTLFLTTTEPYVVVTDSADYYVIIEHETCTAQSNTVSFQPKVGPEEFVTGITPDTGFDIDLFPSPSDGTYIKFQTRFAKENLDVIIVDMLGARKLYQSYKPSNDEIVINFDRPLTNGIYILMAKAQGQTIIKKFVVKR